MKKEKDTHLLAKEQRIGAVVLFVLVAIVVVFVHVVPQRPRETASADSLSVQMADSLRPHSRYVYDTIAIYLHPFDPNTADSLSLWQLGFKRWQVRNLYKYRAAGGRYRHKEDLQRLYGMTDSMYRALEPYICIDTSRFARPDSARYMPQYISHKRDTIIELNSADTTSLQCLRGIGAGIAKQIVRYRQQLGGYHSPEQLREIALLQQCDADSLMVFRFDSVLPYLRAEADSIRPIAVNHASVQRLSRHPYLRFEQAQALYTLRRNRFRLTEMAELKTLSCFSDSDLIRIEPYLSFEK